MCCEQTVFCSNLQNPEWFCSKIPLISNIPTPPRLLAPAEVAVGSQGPAISSGRKCRVGNHIWKCLLVAVPPENFEELAKLVCLCPVGEEGLDPVNNELLTSVEDIVQLEAAADQEELEIPLGRWRKSAVEAGKHQHSGRPADHTGLADTGGVGRRWPGTSRFLTKNGLQVYTKRNLLVNKTQMFLHDGSRKVFPK
ncbi:uncharacterized protein LOC128093228 [Culex pipiens pallens]|uniref:uncharacterized protein LOC128093228 n=1 Tax=Culex pipiens pallens TaxID=42434 RepID=UPI0022AA6CBB|nr:uncharacterized protein LOC128093228 [Culex pipiens pallens]